jgi:hypothetical protein
MNIQRSRLALLLVVITSLLTSCQTVNRVFTRSPANGRAGIVRATKFTEGTLFWSHFDATKRSAIINVDSTGNAIVLAEVTPDAALQKTLEIAGKASVLSKVDAETQLKTASTIAQLGQRTANVNMLRDALYRLAEAANNKPTTFYITSQKDTLVNAKCDNCGTLYERLFKATLNTYSAAVESEAKATIAQAQAEKAKAEADAKKAEVTPSEVKDNFGYCKKQDCHKRVR